MEVTSETLAQVRCRQILPQDLDRVAQLLRKGFSSRTLSYWEVALRRLSERPAPESFPRYGYLLISGNRFLGVLLTIFTAVRNGCETTIRCNISSWYVEPD